MCTICTLQQPYTLSLWNYKSLEWLIIVASSRQGGLIILMFESGASIVDWARERIPPSYETLRLYATIVFLIYGWTSIAFLWKLPSWSYFLNALEITMVAAYILVSNMLESLIVLGVFLFISLVLPPRWLRNDLAVRGSVLMYVLTFWACVFPLNSLIGLPSRSELLAMPIALVVSAGSYSCSKGAYLYAG